MFRRKEKYLREMYKVNPLTGAFVIEVSVDNYNEIFNGWDPSPVKRRDLDPELADYLEDCSLDIPLKYPVEVQFFMPHNAKDAEKEQLSKEGIINNFVFAADFIRKELSDIKKKTFIDGLGAIIFLSLGYLLKQKVQPGFLTAILTEGITIGGWVFLWEAFSLLFFSGQDIQSRLKRYLRFQDTDIVFTYR